MQTLYEKQQALALALTAKAGNLDGVRSQASQRSQRVSGQRSAAEHIQLVQVRFLDPEYFEAHPSHVNRYRTANHRSTTIWFPDRFYNTMTVEELAGLLWDEAMKWKAENREPSNNANILLQVYRVTRGYRAIMTQFPKADQVKAEYSLG